MIMRLQFLIITIMLSGAAVRVSAQGSSSVEWGKPILYQDFEAKPMPTDTAAANISVTILLGYSSTRTGSLKFKVVAVMDKDESWIKDEFKRDHILKHEQGHFDIAHIYAKRLESALKQNRYTPKDVQLLNEIYDNALEEMNAIQIRYDRETSGGWNALAQSKWRRFIQNELKELNGLTP